MFVLLMAHPGQIRDNYGGESAFVQSIRSRPPLAAVTVTHNYSRRKKKNAAGIKVILITRLGYNCPRFDPLFRSINISPVPRAHNFELTVNADFTQIEQRVGAEKTWR